MNMIDKDYGCLSCDDGCNKCTEAAYRCDFDITASPFDPTTWNVTWCGKLHRVKIPTIAETDTSLSTNYSNATLNYTAEAHVDIITGAQLGSLTRMEDLRDVNCDYTTEALCYELIYHKYGDCGEGCMSLENAWATFSIDNEGALQNQIRYVRGANRYSCPQFLDVPSNPNQYWFQMWRGSSEENGYTQPVKALELPEDTLGNYIVASQYPSNKRPVVSVLPWKCMMKNIFANLGVDVTGELRKIQGGPQFYAKFNNLYGNFEIFWTDWNDISDNPVHRAGYGSITGKINWNVTFNIETGTLTYLLHDVYYDKVTWTVDEGVNASVAPTLYLRSVSIPGAAEAPLGRPLTFGKSNVSQDLDVTIPCNQTLSVAPNQVVGPLDFIYLHLDWVVDDEGYMGVQFASKISGWDNCPPGDF